MIIDLHLLTVINLNKYRGLSGNRILREKKFTLAELKCQVSLIALKYDTNPISGQLDTASAEPEHSN